MKKVSSLELKYILKEFEVLENSRVDNIYNFGKEVFYFQYHKSNVGKIILKLLVGKSIFVTEDKESDPAPSNFCQMLRKNLSGKFLRSIEQLESERILKFSYESKDEKRIVYIEFFGSGNIILCNGNNIILNALILHKYKDRNILHKEKYIYPKFDYNFFDLSEKDLVKYFEESNKDMVVTELATGLGFGGVYSEEICLMAGVDKELSPKELELKDIKKINEAIKKISKMKFEPQIIMEDEIIDVVPFSLLKYKESKVKKIKTFSSGFDEYYLTVKPKKKSSYENKLKEFNRVLGEQEKSLSKLRKDEVDNKDKAELIYHKYKLIDEILTEINKASEKLPWTEIRKKLKGHKVIKEINLKDKTVLIEV
tara:strand:+ start:233 stop:1336 length:1104 start_codon:yes stop_codon:yes gene_type:complete